MFKFGWEDGVVCVFLKNVYICVISVSIVSCLFVEEGFGGDL